ncbi:hypothetical protein EGW08_016019 [Elysia chlorotica]|uniref:Uncharacterized protein n=1 Tax=Elysia chlorotica TaxID=188477 RepID=A0A433T3T6_ELYCH|nr:hypothetical protein EGW08_016019 [Elysia chlorotica]
MKHSNKLTLCPHHWLRHTYGHVVVAPDHGMHELARVRIPQYGISGRRAGQRRDHLDYSGNQGQAESLHRYLKVKVTSIVGGDLKVKVTSIVPSDLKVKVTSYVASDLKVKVTSIVPSDLKVKVTGCASTVLNPTYITGTIRTLRSHPFTSTPCKINSLYSSHYELYVTHYELYVTHYELYVTHYELYVTHYELYVTHYELYVTHYELYVTHYELYVTHYELYVTHAHTAVTVSIPDYLHGTLKQNVCDLLQSSRGTVTNLLKEEPQFIVPIG